METNGMKARIEYTVERKGKAIRRAKEVAAERVEKTIEELVDKQGAFNFDVRYEGRATRPDGTEITVAIPGRD